MIDLPDLATPRSRIIVVGVNHRTAPLDVRERLAFVPDELPGALARLRSIVDEGFILSTCNRVEVYGLTHNAEALQRFLVPSGDVSTYCLESEAAVQHLFRVTAGLDSMVLGEHEILGQLRTALSLARAAGTLGPRLGKLGSAAIHAARRARNETSLGRCPASVVTLALRVARVNNKAVLVLGAGALAAGILQRLGKENPRDVVITSRTAAHAAQFGHRTVPWDHRADAIRAADVVIACTSAPTPIITLQHVGRHQLFIDLGVPRDIDVHVRTIARVVDIDELQSLAHANQQRRSEEARRAEVLLTADVQRFVALQAI